jgi:hypothetical protein
MILVAKDKITNKGFWTYDTEKDLMWESPAQVTYGLFFEDTEYFKVDKNNTFNLAGWQDDLAITMPRFFLRCLKHRMKLLGINVTLNIKNPKIFTIKDNSDCAYFILHFHDRIVKSE